MLEELHYAQAHWSEEVSIGRLVLKYTPDMVKAYPPFVNFFENTKEMLQQCDRENPRWLTGELPMISDLYGSNNLANISFFSDFMHSWKFVKRNQSVADKVCRNY